jgi:hypothetical protein
MTVMVNTTAPNVVVAATIVIALSVVGMEWFIYLLIRQHEKPATTVMAMAILGKGRSKYRWRRVALAMDKRLPKLLDASNQSFKILLRHQRKIFPKNFNATGVIKDAILRVDRVKQNLGVYAESRELDD